MVTEINHTSNSYTIVLENESHIKQSNLPELWTTQFTLLVMYWSSTYFASRARVTLAPSTGVRGSSDLAIASKQLNICDSEPPTHTAGPATTS